MATDIDIVNAALSHLGAKADVSAISPPDGSANAWTASRFFNPAIYRALARIDWSFARTRKAMNAVSLPTGCVAWKYAYQKPSDCLTPRRILTADGTSYELDSAAFELEGETFLTNQASAILVYTKPVVDVSKFPVLFQDVVAADLAAYMAGPILRGNEGIKAMGQLRQLAQQLAGAAAATDGNSVSYPEGAGFKAGSISARGGSVPVTESTMIYRG